MRSVEIRRRQIQMLSYALTIAVLLILGGNTGNQGLVFLAIAVEVSSFFILLISSQLPDILGKLLRSRSGKHQYKNVLRIKRNLGLHQLILGLIGTLLLIVLAGPLSKQIFPLSHSYYLFLMISPVILLRTITHVLIGCFQGEGNEFPTVLTLMARPVLWLVLGLTLSKSFLQQGIQVSDLLKQDAYKYVYSAMGVALAMVLAELILALALSTFALLSYKNSGRKNTEGLKATDSMSNLLRIIIKNRWVPMVLSLLTSLPLWMMLVMANRTVDGVSVISDFSVFYVKGLGYFGLLILIACAWFLPLQAKAVYNLKNEGYRYASDSMRRGIVGIVTTMAFFVAYTVVMNEELAKVLTGNGNQLLADSLKKGAVLLLLAVLCYYFMRVLYLLGKRLLLLGIFGGAGVIYLICTFLTVGRQGAVPDVLVNNLLIYAVVLCLALGFFCCAIFRVGPELLMPVLCSLVTAALVFVIQTALAALFTPHLGAAVSLLVNLVLTMLIYWLVILVLRVFRDDDFENLPGGRILLALGQMLHLY